MDADKDLGAYSGQVTEIHVGDGGEITIVGQERPDLATILMVLEVVRLLDTQTMCPCPNCTARRAAMGAAARPN